MPTDWITVTIESFVAAGTMILALVTFLSNRELRNERDEATKEAKNEKKYRFTCERVTNYYIPLLNLYLAQVNSNTFINDLIGQIGNNLHLASNDQRELVFVFYKTVYSSNKPSKSLDIAVRLYNQIWRDYEILTGQIYDYTGEEFKKIGDPEVTIGNLKKSVEILKKQGK